ncbi:hypothetical protein K502DRAFT_67859 [Neoconidiobolus thromboides FSU 785]|nr:hypothetical protein K502DRAFT_67859 [Neoconidiobolus thromboides FSU 785]
MLTAFELDEKVRSSLRDSKLILLFCLTCEVVFPSSLITVEPSGLKFCPLFTLVVLALGSTFPSLASPFLSFSLLSCRFNANFCKFSPKFNKLPPSNTNTTPIQV